MIKNILRLNVTNRCNLSCGSCYIKANPLNEGFMAFHTLQKILCQHRIIPLDVVLEGGEPFLHPQLFLFLEYISTTNNAKKAIISTNGTLIEEFLDSLESIANRIDIQLNVAITKNLLKDEGHLPLCKSLLTNDSFFTSFDVTYSSEEERMELTNAINAHGIPLDRCSFSVLKSYGALKNTEYPKLGEGNNQWICYATDGTFFGNDISARADYELSLSNEDNVPFFDVLHHKDLWLDTEAFIADISFENQDNIAQSVKDFQREYITEHTPDLADYDSYTSAYMYVTGESPVTEEHPYEVEREVVDGLASLMQMTPDMRRFYVYKDIAVKLCERIARFHPKDGVKTNAEDSCKCKR